MIQLLSSDAYTRGYDLDLFNEIRRDKQALAHIALTELSLNEDDVLNLGDWTWAISGCASHSFSSAKCWHLKNHFNWDLDRTIRAQPVKSIVWCKVSPSTHSTSNGFEKE